MSDNDMNEVEDVSFLPGPHVGKKSVYEPSTIQKCKQLICSPTKAALIVSGVVIVVFAIALIAALARPAPSGGCAPTPIPGSQATHPTEATAKNGEPFPWKDILLPTHMVPESYSLFMYPDLSTFQFTGIINMTLVCEEAQDFIVFHSKQLVIQSHALFKEDTGAGAQSDVNIVKSLEYEGHEQVWLKLGETLQKDSKYVLQLHFSGELTDNLAGFYRSSYNTSAGEQRWLATTHFEPTDARAAFPCLDEPALKATFKLSMVRPKTHLALFNTPNVSQEVFSEDPDFVVDHFAETVPMSTYLVAMVVCDYESRHDKTQGGVDVSVYAPREQISHGEFAVGVATSVIDFFGQYFGIEYPLAKSDHIAIPDFQAGAMENWGLITYRMRALLVDPVTSSPSDLQWAAVVISHELAHQWFGNLVTMTWWNDLWLNEGFARYVEFIGTDHVKPKWKMFDQMLTDVTTVAMRHDGLRSSHPISVEVHNPSEIDEIFDAISYEKGAAVIGMCENFLGESVFSQGLQAYLKKHKYANAETDDLWESLSQQSTLSGNQVDVKRVMDTWTRQMGYPVVTVRRQGVSVTVSQQRFLYNPRSNKTKEEFTSDYGYLWEVPLSYITETTVDKPQAGLWLKTQSVTLQLNAASTWIKFNPGMKGFYRVHYDAETWQALTHQLLSNHTVLPAADRASLVEDVFALTRSGHIEVTTAMEISRYLSKEQEFVPWEVARFCLGYIGGLLEGTDAHALFSRYMLNLLERQLPSWDQETDHMTQLRQAALLSEAVHLKHGERMAEAKQFFQDWMNSVNTTLNPNLKSIIYSAGVKYGGEAEWNFMWNKFLVTYEATEKKKYLSALASTEDVTLINRLLNLALDDTKIRSADAVGVFNNLARNPAGRVQTWRFVKRNWGILYDRYKDLGFQLRHLIIDPTSRFSSQFDYDEVSDFFAKNLEGRTVRSVAQTLDSIEMNVDWLSRNEAKLVEWLKQNQSPP